MANKFVIVPEVIYRGLTAPQDTGEPNLDFVRQSLEKVKRERTDSSTKNVNYNQELRRYLFMRNEKENRPARVEVVKGLKMLLKKGEGSDDENEIEIEPATGPSPMQFHSMKKSGRRKNRINSNNSSLWWDKSADIQQTHDEEQNLGDLDSIPFPNDDENDLFEDAEEQQAHEESVNTGINISFKPQIWPMANIDHLNSTRQKYIREKVKTKDIGLNQKSRMIIRKKSKNKSKIVQLPENSASVEENSQENAQHGIKSASQALIPASTSSSMKIVHNKIGQRKWAPYPPIEEIKSRRQLADLDRPLEIQQSSPAAVENVRQSGALPQPSSMLSIQAPMEIVPLPKSTLKIKHNKKVERKWAPYPPIQAQMRAKINGARKKTSPLTYEMQNAIQSPEVQLALPAPPERKQKFDPNLIRVVTIGLKKRKPSKLGEEIVPVKKSKPSPQALTAGTSIPKHLTLARNEKKIRKYK